MSKIVVGFDGSAESKRAAWKAAELAVGRGSTLVVAQIVPPIILPGEWPTMPAPGFTQQQLMGAEQQVGAAAKELSTSGARLQSAVICGAPAEELLRIAEEDPEVELVVVGRSGKGAIARALLGSVSSRLAHACTRPVLIIP